MTAAGGGCRVLTDAGREYRDHHSAEWDRAAGALLGAAAGACLVGADPAAVARLLDDNAGSGEAGHLGWLITTSLGSLPAHDPARFAEAVPLDTERAWARALRAVVRGGGVPEPAPDLQHGPITTAWRAVVETPVPELDPARGRFPCRHLVEAVWTAHGGGGDVAAMYAGALAGARWGASGVPLDVLRRVGDILAPRDLITAAVVTARGTDPQNWPEFPTLLPNLESPVTCVPFCTPHPHDPGVELCNLVHVRSRSDAEAVVSLCRTGGEDVPAAVPVGDRVEVWIHDRPKANPNLHFLLDQAAAAVAALRAEGKRVLLHCAAGQSRTPAVAAHYAALVRGADPIEAMRTVISAVGGHLDNPELSRAVAELHGRELADPAAVLFPDGVEQVRRRSA